MLWSFLALPSVAQNIFGKRVVSHGTIARTAESADPTGRLFAGFGPTKRESQPALGTISDFTQ